MSIRNSTRVSTEEKKIARFCRLDNEHISAIESLYKTFPFLKERVEVHMPFHRAKPTFSTSAVYLWPKFDKRPVGYLVFMDGFAPCIWYPDRQEGMTFRWMLPPGFCQVGPTVCLANILAGESTLQIEDLVIYQGNDLWSSMIYSARWNRLRDFWNSLPADQPLLAFQPRIVTPLSLEQWPTAYDPSIYWIIQPDYARQPRWYWKDTVTPLKKVEYIAPKMKRDATITATLVARCKPYTQVLLPDTYSLESQEGTSLGIACISTMDISLSLRKLFSGDNKSLEAEVKWNDQFRKYQITRIMPKDTPITTASFFNHV
jgi:hypothetical protein